MKKVLFLLIAGLLLVFVQGKTHAVTYEIKDFEGGNNGLKNHSPSFVTNDVLELQNDLTVDSDIGYFNEITLKLNGNNYTISGDNKYSGFIFVGDNSNYTFNNVILSDFVKESVGSQSKGAVFYNSDGSTVNILNSTIQNNKVSVKNEFGYGGVIYNHGTTNTAELNIINSHFANNIIDIDYDKKGEPYGGGVIFNSGVTKLSITDSTFKNNSARALVYSYGGAIANYGLKEQNVQVTINNCVFDGNSSISQKDTGYGGAIYNNAQTERNSVINDSKFVNNIAQGTFGRGGAIYNDQRASLSVNNSIFDGNSVIGKFNSTGGAIDNWSNSTTIIRNSIFINNSVFTNAGGNGGAIANAGILNLIADNGIIKFSANTAGSFSKFESNAINNTGILHINTSRSGILSIEDKITGDRSKLISTININKPGTAGNDTPIVDAPTSGNVMVFETIKSENINLYNGMFSLGQSGNNIVRDGNYFIDVNLSLHGGILNFANENIDNISLEKLNSQIDAKLYIDADLSANLMDNFTVANAPTGKIEIAGINILADSDINKTLNLFNGASLDLSGVNLKVYTDSNVYSVKSSVSGKLDFESTNSSAGLLGAVSDNTVLYRSFSTAIEENITTALGAMGGGSGSMVTVFGNMHNLNGNRNSGIIVGDAQIFKVFSMGSIATDGSIINAINGFVKASNNQDNNGGFLDNNGTSDIFRSAFLNNRVVSADAGSTSSGGAIYNSKDLALSYTAFSANIAQAVADASGGAIYNNKDVSMIYSTFRENKAISTNGEARGGAIYNEGTMSIVNASFYDNTADGLTAKGGAIYNSGTLNILTSFSDIEFKGNKANGLSNAIYNAGTLNLNTGQGNKIVFHDAIEGQDRTASLININKSDESSVSVPSNGEVVFNDKVTNSTINFHSGILTPSKESNLDGNNFNFHGGFLNFLNNEIGTMAIENASVSGNTRWAIDLDLENATGDKISAKNVSASTGRISIASINLLSDAKTSSTIISIVSDNLRNNVDLGVTRALTPIYQYRLNYDQTTGSIKIGGGPFTPDPTPTPPPIPPYENFNPAVLAAPVAAQVGSYLTQLNSYDEAFNNMDMYMLMPRAQRNALKFGNKIASASSPDGFYSPLMTPQKEKGIWFKPYSNFENVPLKNGPKVSNVSYGSFMGADSELKELGRGFDGVFTLYAGYNGSHQAYDGIGIYQNGGIAGASAVVYKGNFFSGLTANAGASSGEASTMYGRDSFTMLTAGIASKTGYNWELLDSKLVIQPNYLMSYSFVNTYDYTNPAGVRISSSPLNAIQISPGLRVIGNLKNGWQPYLGVSMVWNIIDETKFKANDVSLPLLSVKPYIEYGAGVQKRVGERFTGFGQAMIRNGGRNGISFMLGFRYALY